MRGKIIAKMKQKLADPEFAELRRKAVIAGLSDPAVRAKNSTSKKKAFSTPEYRLRKSKKFKVLLRNPERLRKMRAAQYAAVHDVKHNAKRIAGIIASHSTDEVRSKISEGTLRGLRAKQL